MIPKKVKWGVLSTENTICEALLSAFGSSSNAELYAVAGNGGKIRSISNRLQIEKHYENYEEILNDPNVDAVYIRLPINLRHEWIIRAASAKKHVWCEKSAALNAEEAAEIINVCEDNGVIFMEASMHLFHSQHEKVKQLIQDGLVGDVKMMRASFSFCTGNRESEFGEGILYDLVSDCVSSIRNIFGTEPRSVVACGERDQNGVETTVGVLLNYRDNRYALVDCSFEMTMRNEYEVIGTKGMIKLPFAYRPDLNGGDGIIEVFTENTNLEITIKEDQNLRTVEHISDCILRGTIPAYSRDNIWKNIDILDSVSQSLTKGSAVTLVESKRRVDIEWGAECGIAAFLKR
ncbi:Gfo/Idh/MocA family protein [Effusibacillus consociatus]|uniref:Gfo/Idh/MocA family protein n=1 Tax=Effusibacillus consociatus TaxID=1117041 RepID=A0ABV9PYQ2_9BACL